MTNTNYRIVNPSAGDDYFTAAGAAYDAKADFTDSKTPAAQPTINSGRAKKLYSDRDLLNALGEGYLRRNNGSVVVAGDNVGSAAWASASVTITSVAEDGSAGFCVFTLNSHGLSVGNILNIHDANNKVGGIHRITAVTTNTFTTTKQWVTGAGVMNYLLASGNFATMTAERWVMRRANQAYLGGVAKTTLRSGASGTGDRRRSIHKAQQLRTLKVTTAIRAGYWVPYDGAWSTAPTNTDEGYYSISDDAGQWDGSADEAANPTMAKPGELVYKEPKPLPDQNDYAARTIW